MVEYVTQNVDTSKLDQYVGDTISDRNPSLTLRTQNLTNRSEREDIGNIALKAQTSDRIDYTNLNDEEISNS